MTPKEKARKKLSIVNAAYLEGHRQTFGEERKPLKDGETFVYVCSRCSSLRKCKQVEDTNTEFYFCPTCNGIMKYSYKEIIISGKDKNESQG
jgi:hypothetical protein